MPTASSRSALASAALALLLVAACGEPARERADKPLATVDVGPAQDAEMDISGDAVGPPMVLETAAALPADFPAGFPLYRPSTMVDFGSGTSGWRYVLFMSPDRPSRVRAGMEAALEAAGWRAAGAQGTLRGPTGREARIAYREDPPGTEIRVEYRPGS